LYIGKSTLKEKNMKTITLYRPGLLERPSALSDFDRYFESFFEDSPLAPATRIFNRTPAVDIRETEKSYKLEMELPGYDEQDIEIHVEGSTLSIASKHEETKETTPQEMTAPQETPTPKETTSPAETWLVKERRVSAFNRSFKLPENANPEEVTAEFKNGILGLEIQKRAEAQKRAIHIKVK
jgi:HSP20 family protein